MIQDSGIKQEKIKEFTDLIAWQEAHKLVVMIYRKSKSFPKSELFGLVDQMRRAAVSITSNIAEGFGRHGYREKVQFYYLAQGSLTEVKNQILIARDIAYLTTADFQDVISQANHSHKLLQGLIGKTKTFLNPES